MNPPKVPPPATTGWADFGGHSFSSAPAQPDKKDEDSWFDFVDGFSNTPNTEMKKPAAKPVDTKEEAKEDMTWSYFDFSKK